MNRPRWWIIGLVLLGVAALVYRGSSAAQERQPDKDLKWEYKIIGGNYDGFHADDLEKALNKQGSEGWEYAGRLERLKGGGGQNYFNDTLIILKRPKH